MKQGIVHHYNLQKGLYVIKISEESYTVFESYDIQAFKIGDHVFGDFSKCGLLDVLNARSLSWSKVIVQSVDCDEVLAMDKVAQLNTSK